MAASRTNGPSSNKPSRWVNPLKADEAIVLDEQYGLQCR